jgi:hypothetical protein
MNAHHVPLRQIVTEIKPKMGYEELIDERHKINFLLLFYFPYLFSPSLINIIVSRCSPHNSNPKLDTSDTGLLPRVQSYLLTTSFPLRWKYHV